MDQIGGLVGTPQSFEAESSREDVPPLISVSMILGTLDVPETCYMKVILNFHYPTNTRVTLRSFGCWMLDAGCWMKRNLNLQPLYMSNSFPIQWMVY